MNNSFTGPGAPPVRMDSALVVVIALSPSPVHGFLATSPLTGPTPHARCRAQVLHKSLHHAPCAGWKRIRERCLIQSSVDDDDDDDDDRKQSVACRLSRVPGIEAGKGRLFFAVRLGSSEWGAAGRRW
ncbi:hypothetical protein ZHAS_00012274 [Anopheles sinensis]|uniref:Uncharacterized protein n=1 Tax=Anopheles sinensis TaxID=74873 RepID=A0A084W292_ANOSI|nr:hypothetical protein ZHAS_00012274 [Anopheles sinensis]